MRRLSAFLEMPVDERLWPSLVEAASFQAMRARADETAPGAHVREWRSNVDFFRQGRLGQWRTGLSAESLAFYDRVANRRLDGQLRRWLESGRAASGDPKLL